MAPLSPAAKAIWEAFNQDEAEVAELVAWLRETGDLACQADAEEGQRYWSAADLLERLSPPQPIQVSERLPVPGEMVE